MTDDRPDDLMAALRASVEAAKKRRTDPRPKAGCACGVTTEHGPHESDLNPT